MTTPEEYRTQFEQYLWEATQWQGDSALIETIIGVADQYAHNLAEALAEKTLPLTIAEAWGDVDFEALVNDMGDASQPVPELVELFNRPRATLPAYVESSAMIIDIPVPEKDCRGCGTSKSLDEFHKDRQNSDGRRYLCKTCDADAKRDWRRRDLQRRAAFQAAYEELQRQREGVSGDHARDGAPAG